MRRRLLAWYAAVLVAVIAGLALTLYLQTRRSTFEQIDEQLAGAVSSLEATLRRFPLVEFGGEGPFGLRPLERAAAPLSAAQRRQIDELDAQARSRLLALLTPEQRQTLEDIRFGADRRGDETAARADSDARERPLPRGPAPDGNGPPSPAALRARVLADLELTPSLEPRRGDPPRDQAYFIVWRPDGIVLRATAKFEAPPLPIVEESGGAGLSYRQRGLAREAYRRGPHATTILVGKPVGRELSDLSRFGWRLAATGCLALAIGLAGGWALSRGIVRPLEQISATAAAISAANLSGRIDADRLDNELVGLARVLNEMFSRLESEFSRQARFTADASHELRTPLALLHSQIELALKRHRTADEYREALETCARASGRMRSLLDGLLTLARADAGHLAVAFQPVDLNGIVEEVAAQHFGESERARVALSTALPQSPVLVSGDPLFLSRVLTNLLTNSLRHTPDGGAIEISLTAGDGRARLIVADTGCGIALEDQPRIFERFFRADKARSRASGGSGLGLAICKSIVEAHAGTIEFSSTPDKGTTFVVQVPTLGRG